MTVSHVKNDIVLDQSGVVRVRVIAVTTRSRIASARVSRLHCANTDIDD
jgi:hypothetical protein